MPEVDEKRLDEIWGDDLLNRRAEAEWLEQYLSNASSAGISPLGRKSFIININGEWGSGKTFFVDRFQKHLETKGHLVGKLDAWRTDPSSDPIVSLVACIEKCIDPHISKKTIIQNHLKAVYRAGGKVSKVIAPALVKQSIKRLVGKDTLEELREIVGDNLSDRNSEKLKDAVEVVGDAVDSIEDEVLDSYTTTTYFAERVANSQAQFEAIREFSEGIEDLLKSLFKKQNIEAPLYIIIDELDRCRPTFAIEVLERINHLFDLEGIVFLVCTDTDQLAHSVRAVYGHEFSSHDYLSRFFSFRYELMATTLEQLYLATLKEFQIDQNKFILPQGLLSKDALCDIICALVSSPRQLRQILYLLRTFLIATEKQVDPICLLVSAVAVFHREFDVIEKAIMPAEKMTNKSKLERRIRSVRINHSRFEEHGRSEEPLAHYIRTVMNVEADSLHKLAERSSTSFTQAQLVNLARAQLRSGSASVPNWSNYIAELKTASRLTETIIDDIN